MADEELKPEEKVEEIKEEEKSRPEEYLSSDEVDKIIERIKNGEVPSEIAKEYGVGRLGDIVPPERKEEYNRVVKVAATKRYKAAKKTAEPKEKPEPKREAAKEVAKERVKPKPQEAPKAEERVSVSKDNKWLWIVAAVAIAAAVYLMWRKREEIRLERGKRLIDKAFGQENPPQPPQPPQGPQGPKSWRSEYGV
jgi:hypothetical protein